MTEVHGGMAVIEVLRAFGVTQFFNVPGESFLPVLEALRTEPTIRVVTNRHESGASFAAEGFGKMSGRPAVCMATRGPGASNLSIGIQTAQYDSTPLVALLGLIPTTLQGSQAFQEFDSLSMFGSFAKRSLVVASRASLEATIAQALTDATSGRPGPVVVGLPADLLSVTAPLAQFGFPDTSAQVTPDIQPLLDRIGSASRPAFIMSTGAVRGSCAAEVGGVALRLGAPVLCGWRRFSAFDNGHPCFAGSIGLGSGPAVAATLEQADLVIAFGPIDPVTVDSGHLNRAGLMVVNVTSAPDPFLARRMPLANVSQIVCEPEIVARLLAAEVRKASGATHAQINQAAPRLLAQELTAETAVSRFNEWAPADAVIVSDAGDFAHALLRQFRFDQARTFIGPLNGAMGYGLPAAIGAQLAAPGRPVFCIAGDGGLLMTAGEMETATRLNLDIAVIVFNNQAYGTIRSRQAEAFPGHEFGTTLGEVSFTDLAKAMGWRAWPARTPSEFEAALSSVATSSGCRLIEVRL
ncbi:MAG TPA: thiamine pyrophosphate-binding protein [Clostridia bacterium]|nr:thiamine pyrophosphate-binding protein [Clostridia bacterium]